MDLNKRLIVIFLGILVIVVSLMAYRITSGKRDILITGQIVKTKISKTTNDGNIKTINVKISDVEYSAGEAFGEYNNKVAGDTIMVHYLKSMDYVVLKGEKTYMNAFIFQIIVIIGGLLIIFGIFNKENSYKQYVPYTMRFDFDSPEESEH